MTRPAAMLLSVCIVAALLITRVVAFVPISNDEVIRLQELRQTKEQKQQTGCPFSKPFRRYRIDFSTTKDKDDSALKLPFFSGISLAMEKVRFLQQQDEAQWLDGKDGVQALASLWRAAADLQHSTESQSIILAFPDCSERLLQRFIDILDWANQEESIETPTRVNAVMMQDLTIPAIRLTREGDPSRIVNPNPVDPSITTKRTQAWVKRLLVDLGLCPHTKAVTKSGQGLGDVGVPVASISYDTSNAMTNQVYMLMADTWESINRMLQAGPSGKDGVSSILLAAPAFDADFDLWAGPIFAVLESGVVAAKAEQQVGVVCFHPHYATPDGSSWPGFGHMHSVPRLQKWLAESGSTEDLTEEQVAAGGAWQRRTPHATINVLRADQLEIAEKRRTTGNLYTENICKLVGTDGIGSETLAADLEQERRLSL